MGILPQIQPLIAEDRLGDLGPGTPDLAVKPMLDVLARDLPGIAKERGFASACLAGLWLCHGFFDESHAISQDLDTLEGSFWHGILHRREPDYGNAKYWFRRVPAHPVFAELHAAALAVPAPAGPAADFRSALVGRKAWDPFAFVDLCELAGRRGTAELVRYCGDIQRAEWKLLFAYCHERAFSSWPPVP